MPLVPSYKPLKRTMLDRDLSRADLLRITEIAPNTYTKINKNEWLALSVIAQICQALNCRIEDVVEFVEEP